MKKILITLLTAMLFLTGCSVADIKGIEEEAKIVAESHGLKDVSISTERKKSGDYNTIGININTSGGFSELKGTEMADIYLEINKIESKYPIKKGYIGTLLVFEDDDEYLLTKEDIYKNNSHFRFGKSKKKNNNSSKEDWYNEHPGDSDWKNVVDGLTELYGGDE